MKPTETRAITDTMRASTGSGKWRLNPATAAIHPTSIRIHSKSEPSWPPQTAAIL